MSGFRSLDSAGYQCLADAKSDGHGHGESDVISGIFDTDNAPYDEKGGVVLSGGGIRERRRHIVLMVWHVLVFFLFFSFLFFPICRCIVRDKLVFAWYCRANEGYFEFEICVSGGLMGFCAVTRFWSPGLVGVLKRHNRIELMSSIGMSFL